MHEHTPQWVQLHLIGKDPPTLRHEQGSFYGAVAAGKPPTADEHGILTKDYCCAIALGL